MTIIEVPLRSSKSDTLGRYYTTALASKVLVNELRTNHPRRVLDLGCGDGALSVAARSAWKDAEIVTVDIDGASSTALKRLASVQETGVIRHFSVDALRPDLPAVLGGENALSDLAICNPPFIKPKWRKGFEDVLKGAGLDDCYTSKHDITGEVLFLAQNLRLVRTAGHIGIIVPDSIVAGKKHRGLRECLLACHRIESVIRLPRTAFAGTDAQGYILVLTKDRPSVEGIVTREMFSDGTLGAPLRIDPREAAVRLDMSFQSTGQPRRSARLIDLVASVKRGNVSSSERLQLPTPAFHTTDFPADGLSSFCFGRKFDIMSSQPASGVYAKAGDILLARVGRNLEKKICIVAKGIARVTDCVYVIRPLPDQTMRIFNALSSNRGRDWLARVSHGVSARQLPKCDLLQFPI
jgi:type I restriction enzyme M protein